MLFTKDYDRHNLCGFFSFVMVFLLPSSMIAENKLPDELIPGYYIISAFDKNPIKSNEKVKLIISWWPKESNLEFRLKDISISNPSLLFESQTKIGPNSVRFVLKGFDTGRHKIALTAEIDPLNKAPWFPGKLIFFSPELTVESRWSVPKPLPEIMGFAVVILSALIGGFWSYWKEIRAKKKADELLQLKNDFVLLNFFSAELSKNKNIFDDKKPEPFELDFYLRYISEKALPEKTYWAPDYNSFEKYYNCMREYNLKLPDFVTQEDIDDINKKHPDLRDRLRSSLISMEDQYEDWRKRLDKKFNEIKKIL